MPKKGQKLIRLSEAAYSSLDRILAKVNLDFYGGRLDQTDLANWIVRHFEAAEYESKIESIRTAHFDQLKFMRHLVAETAKARKEGNAEIDQDLMKILVANAKKQINKKAEQPIKES